MLVGSVANGLCSAGGFCAGSKAVVDHQVRKCSHCSSHVISNGNLSQRINGPSFVFSAAMPALLAVSASEGINILRHTPSILAALQDNIRVARSILDRLDCIIIPSHPASPIIHIHIRPPSPSTLQVPPTTGVAPRTFQSKHILPRDPEKFDIEVEERMLQDVVEECLGQGVMITRAKRLRGQEMVEARPSIRLAMTSALTRKETEKAVGVVKTALVKVLGKRR